MPAVGVLVFVCVPDVGHVATEDVAPRGIYARGSLNVEVVGKRAFDASTAATACVVLAQRAAGLVHQRTGHN